MKTMALSEFNADASHAVSGVASSGEDILITEGGKPPARVVPCSESDQIPVPDKLAGTVVFLGDIVSPLPADMWEVNR